MIEKYYMSQGSDYTAKFNDYKDRIRILGIIEADILKEHIKFPMPTAIRRMIVFGLPRKRFQDTKEELQTQVASKKTDARMDFIAQRVKELNTNSNFAAIKNAEDKWSLGKNKESYLDKILNTLNKGSLSRWDLRRAAREIKVLKGKIKNLDITEEEKSILFGSLEEIRTILSNELEERSYRLKLKNGLYVKSKTDFSDLPSIYKVFFVFRLTHKTLGILFTALALIGVTLAILAMLFFPPLGATALTIMAVASIGICYCTIALSLERFIKWAADRAYFGLPFTRAQLLSGIIGGINVILSVVFIISSVFALIPGASSALAIPNFPNLSAGINNAINNINKVISTAVGYITVNFIAIKTPIDALYTAYLVVSISVGIEYFRGFVDSLTDMYQNRNAPVVAPDIRSDIIRQQADLMPPSQNVQGLITEIKEPENLAMVPVVEAVTASTVEPIAEPNAVPVLEPIAKPNTVPASPTKFKSQFFQPKKVLLPLPDNNITDENKINEDETNSAPPSPTIGFQ